MAKGGAMRVTTLAFVALMAFGACNGSPPGHHLPPHHNAPPCLLNEFTCRDQTQCVMAEHLCDGTPDCRDRSDEEKCEEEPQQHCDDPSFFKCADNVTCINPGWLCDLHHDCPDGSDEVPDNCHEYHGGAKAEALTQENGCGEEEFACSDGLCIPNELVCDDISNCLDGSDEDRTMCASRPCDPAQYFQCVQSKHCIPIRWRCDENMDCTDGSDEINCKIGATGVGGAGAAIECLNGTFNCNDGATCLDLAKVCDGNQDCPNGSDESANCSSSCDNIKCESVCLKSPVGNGTCTCPQGYSLMEDGLQCEDKDECLEYGICDQECTNEVGSFQCSCVEGYHIFGNACRANGNIDAMLFFSGKSEVRGMNLRTGGQFTVTKDREWANTAIGIAYDAMSDRVFWTALDKTKSRIVSSQRDGKDPRTVVADLVMPESLAIDHVARNVYYSEPAEDYLGVCSIDGKWCAKLHSRDVRQPREIALYTPKGILFYTDWGLSPKISSVGMDGGHPENVITDNLHWPNGISVDHATKRIYWSDAKHDLLESSFFDGDDRRQTSVTVIKHPFSLAVFENRLYWSDWDLKKIQSCNKFTGQDRQVLFNDTEIEPFGIHVFHPALEPVNQKNPCYKQPCSHLCLLAYGGRTYTCKCPEDMTLGPDERTCKANQKALPVKPVEVSPPEESQTEGKNNNTLLRDLPFGKQSDNATSLPAYDVVSSSSDDLVSSPSDDGSTSVSETSTAGSNRRLKIGLGVGVVLVLIVLAFILVCVLTYRKKSDNEPSPVLRYKNPAFGYQESFDDGSDMDIFVDGGGNGTPEPSKKKVGGSTDLTRALDDTGRPGSKVTSSVPAMMRGMTSSESNVQQASEASGQNNAAASAAADSSSSSRLGFQVWRPRTNNRYIKL